MTCIHMLLWRIGPFLLTNISYRHCNFWCISSRCWAYFSDEMASVVFRKLRWIRPAAESVTMTFFGASLPLGSLLELLLSPTTKLVPTKLVITSCIKSTFRHVTIWSRNGSLLLHILDDTSKQQFFNLHSTHEAPGEGNGNPVQYSCLENPMDGGSW